MNGIPKREKLPICKNASKALLPGWKMIFHNSRKLDQIECNNIHYFFIIPN
jgi:hypothetical protein